MRRNRFAFLLGLSLTAACAAPADEAPWTAPEVSARSLPEAMYVELDRALARHGLARPTTRTPLEHLAFVEASGFDEVAAVRAVTEAYARARYGGRGLTPEEKRGLAAAVERVRRGGE